MVGMNIGCCCESSQSLVRFEELFEQLFVLSTHFLDVTGACSAVLQLNLSSSARAFPETAKHKASRLPCSRHSLLAVCVFNRNSSVSERPTEKIPYAYRICHTHSTHTIHHVPRAPWRSIDHLRAQTQTQWIATKFLGKLTATPAPAPGTASDRSGTRASCPRSASAAARAPCPGSPRGTCGRRSPAATARPPRRRSHPCRSGRPSFSLPQLVPPPLAPQLPLQPALTVGWGRRLGAHCTVCCVESSECVRVQYLIILAHHSMNIF